MSAQPTALRAADRHQAILSATRRGVVARLADPYLTDHDRWVLGQFAAFLGGATPEPDPRVPAIEPERLLPSRARRATL